MTDALDGVRDRYRVTGATGRLKIALAVLGPEDRPLTPQQPGRLHRESRRVLSAGLRRDFLEGRLGSLTVVFEASSPKALIHTESRS